MGLGLRTRTRTDTNPGGKLLAQLPGEATDAEGQEIRREVAPLGERGDLDFSAIIKNNKGCQFLAVARRPEPSKAGFASMGSSATLPWEGRAAGASPVRGGHGRGDARSRQRIKYSGGECVAYVDPALHANATLEPIREFGGRHVPFWTGGWCTGQ